MFCNKSPYPHYPSFQRGMMGYNRSAVIFGYSGTNIDLSRRQGCTVFFFEIRLYHNTDTNDSEFCDRHLYRSQNVYRMKYSQIEIWSILKYEQLQHCNP